MSSPTPRPVAPPVPMLSSRPRVVVGVALLDAASGPRRLLAARRTGPPALAGLWEFPGGKVEEGEEHRAALAREVREELGVRVRLGAEVVSPDAQGWELANGARMRVFFGVLDDDDGPGPRPLQDHDRLEWTVLEADALQGLDWIPADRPIVDALLDHVRAGRTGL